jgi:hypothetical protein
MAITIRVEANLIKTVSRNLL